jgi:hypothetical protein
VDNLQQPRAKLKKRREKRKKKAGLDTRIFFLAAFSLESRDAPSLLPLCLLFSCGLRCLVEEEEGCLVHDILTVWITAAEISTCVHFSFLFFVVRRKSKLVMMFPFVSALRELALLMLGW